MGVGTQFLYQFVRIDTPLSSGGIHLGQMEGQIPHDNADEEGHYNVSHHA
jgi:hypothetical protein